MFFFIKQKNAKEMSKVLPIIAVLFVHTVACHSMPSKQSEQRQLQEDIFYLEKQLNHLMTAVPSPAATQRVLDEIVKHIDMLVSTKTYSDETLRTLVDKQVYKAQNVYMQNSNKVKIYKEWRALEANMTVKSRNDAYSLVQQKLKATTAYFVKHGISLPDLSLVTRDPPLKDAAVLKNKVNNTFANGTRPMWTTCDGSPSLDDGIGWCWRSLNYPSYYLTKLACNSEGGNYYGLRTIHWSSDQIYYYQVARWGFGGMTIKPKCETADYCVGSTCWYDSCTGMDTGSGYWDIINRFAYSCTTGAGCSYALAPVSWDVTSPNQGDAGTNWVSLNNHYYHTYDRYLAHESYGYGTFARPSASYPWAEDSTFCPTTDCWA